MKEKLTVENVEKYRNERGVREYNVVLVAS